MQKKWETLLADQFEGGVSTEKALLDIKRGIMENLYHESVGLWATSRIKNVQLLDELNGTGIVAIDRIRNLTWKDYKPIAKGESSIVPHTGNVDTYQIPIDSMSYLSQELPETDLVRMKNSPSYRARLVYSMAKTWGATIDGEMFDLLLAAAAGQKGGVLEVELPVKFDPNQIDLYLKFADIASEIEQTVNEYYIGINRSEIVVMVSPYLYTRLIRGITGAQMVVESKILGWIQDEKIVASKISGLYIIRHPFIGRTIPKVATNDFGHYDLTGIHALIYHTATGWFQSLFNNTNGVINKDTGNYRMIQRIVWGKGLVYGDLVRVLKAPSTKDKPFGWEKNLIENRITYNNNYGFRDWKIEIPETLEALQKNYTKLK